MTLPALFVPGTLCDQAVYEPMLAHLDLEPNHAPPIDWPDVASAANALLDCAPRRFLGIGFSLGGFVLLELLRRAPERLLGMVFIASNPLPLRPGKADGRRADATLARERGVSAVIARLWPNYVAPHRLDNVEIRSAIEAMAERVGVERFVKQTELGITRPDSRDTLRSATLPILALCGAVDRAGPPGSRQSFEEITRVRVVEFAKTGHFIPLEAPQHAAAAITSWLTDEVKCISE